MSLKIFPKGVMTAESFSSWQASNAIHPPVARIWFPKVQGTGNYLPMEVHVCYPFTMWYAEDTHIGGEV